MEADTAGGYLCPWVWGIKRRDLNLGGLNLTLSSPFSPAPLTPSGQIDLNKRASLPAEPVVTFPESPSEPRDEAIGVPRTLRQDPRAAGTSSEANGPWPRSSLPVEQEQSQEMAASEAGVGEVKGGCVVTVVWEGLRATEDCAIGATGPELEAKVEEMVLEAIGDRPEADHPEPGGCEDQLTQAPGRTSGRSFWRR